MGKLIRARFGGECADCGRTLEAGTTVNWLGRGKGITCLGCPTGGTTLEDTEVGIGMARADHIRTTRQMFGEGAAAAEELAWELRDPAY